MPTLARNPSASMKSVIRAVDQWPSRADWQPDCPGL
jgi:hypothetical protein